jgi:hypothetical protein
MQQRNARSRTSVLARWRLFAAIVTLGAASCARPPAAVTPANPTEQAVLTLAAQKVPSDWTVPTEITTGPTPGTFRVTYSTPDHEIELLGLRQIIVDPVAATVQFVPRD